MLPVGLLFLVALSAGAKTVNLSTSVRIYSNLAEIIQPLEQLPLEFSNEDWQHIRSDSITLLADNLNITSQTITEKKEKLDGAEILIRSPVSSEKHGIKLINGVLIDETINLIRIQDSATDGVSAYLTVPRDQIFFLREPPKPKFYVNFTYDTSDSNLHVSYLRSAISWRTQYQLNLNQNDSDLIAMANIRNDGDSALSIEKAELIGGDVNLQMTSPNQNFRRDYSSFKGGSSMLESGEPASMFKMGSSAPTVAQGKELVGLYVFLIDRPFPLDAKSNYLVPMFRPHVTVERYSFISKFFSTMASTGKPQRSYRLRSDRYLSRGNCILREKHRIVGETSFPDLAAQNTHVFSIGEDADIVYRENVTLISSAQFNETQSIVKTTANVDDTKLIILTRVRSFHEVRVQVINFKSRPVKIEYEQGGAGFQSYELVESPDNRCLQDGSIIKFNMNIDANSNATYTYTVRTVV